MTDDLAKLTRVAKAAVKYRALARDVSNPRARISWTALDAAVAELDAAIAALKA